MLSMKKIIVTDPNRATRNAIAEFLGLNDFEPLCSKNGLETIEIIQANKDVSLVICDISLSDMTGQELLQNIHTNYSEVPIIVMSTGCSIDLAVECMHLGATDILEKPINMNRLLASINNALKREEIVKENKALKRKIHNLKSLTMIGESAAMGQLNAIIEKVAPTNARVLITGANGTGKELAARALHLLSTRAANTFVAVNCAAIPSELIESELFGHEKGSFTSAVRQRPGKFEVAQSGTIFLDEVGDMSLSAQAKVLRVLQENRVSRVGSDRDIEIDVRVIAATNKDLEQEIKFGRFREDLYHRLSVIKLRVPSLSERREDIPRLINYFMQLICDERKVTLSVIDTDALEFLGGLSWRGNIRELRNSVERLLILSDDPSHITRRDVESYCADGIS